MSSWPPSWWCATPPPNQDKFHLPDKLGYSFWVRTSVSGPGLDGVAERALAAAADGLAAGRNLTVAERVAELVKLKQLILTRRSRIIDRVQAEAGWCRTDVLAAQLVTVVEWIGWLERNAARLLAPRRAQGNATLVREPLGVVLVICPWNDPFGNAITAIAAAVVTGNAVVCQPSDEAPCAGLIEEVIACSPVLERLVHVVYGDDTMTEALVDAGPAKVFFTGAASTGSSIMARAAAQLIPVDLELDGKDAMIVFDDVPLARPVAGALWGAFANAGQSRGAVQRLLVQDTVYERFMTALRREAGKLSAEADIGRVTTARQRDAVIEHLRDALRRGARLRYGRIPDATSLLVEPVIVDIVSADMLLWREATPGPVLPVLPFTDEAEAIRVVNESEYGLSASVFSADSRRAVRVARALEVGGVSINNVNQTEQHPGLPFGGVKRSGPGRSRGPEGLLAYTTSKALVIDRSSPAIEANWFPYTAEKLSRLMDALPRRRGRGVR
jgi:acyl-CoA reductase-like NAD-dependent aldehyde dehydrogenase